MSLLDSGNEVITVYPATEYADADGNPSIRPSQNGTVTRASVQPLGSTEKDTIGFETRTRYRVRPVRSFPEIPPGSEIEWNGKRYTTEGFALRYGASRRTARLEYRMVRS